ncbi:MAG: hypothetical protein ACRCWJ_18350, partial [Casimicrobium sp.]
MNRAQLSTLLNRTALALLVTSGLLASAGAATLYVAPSGSNAGNCQTVGTPCQTIAYALTQAAASGDTINIAAGTYAEELTINKSVLLQGASAATTIIKAPAALTVNAAIPGSGGQQTAIVFVTGATTNAELRTLEVQGPGNGSCGSLGYGVFVGGSANFIFRSGRVTLARDTIATPLACGTQNGSGIRFGAQSTSQSGSGQVLSSTILTYQKNGITADNTGSAVTIQNNTITGELPPPNIAQNGIQVSRGATATISG